jgi:glutathione S-transferase
MSHPLTLISHHLCPYVQRAIITLTEKKTKFNRIYINLADKPDWFINLSPMGKTPILKVDETSIFESNVILEYLEETQIFPLHPVKPLERADNRSWIEFSSILLNNIGALYSAKTKIEFEQNLEQLSNNFDQLEKKLSKTPYFNGEKFSLVDACYGPVFRYFDVLDEVSEINIWSNKPKLAHWRKELSNRPSVREAVNEDYPIKLQNFLINKKSYLSNLIT